MASNITAAVLSALVPGLGQFYKGHLLRGLFFLLFFWTVIVYVIGIVDAYLLDSHIHGVNVISNNNNVIQVTMPKVEVVKDDQ